MGMATCCRRWPCRLITTYHATNHRAKNTKEQPCAHAQATEQQRGKEHPHRRGERDGQLGVLAGRHGIAVRHATYDSNGMSHVCQVPKQRCAEGVVCRRCSPVGYNQLFMSSTSQSITRTPAEVVRMAPVSQAGNGICYSVMGEITAGVANVERMVTLCRVPSLPPRSQSVLLRPAHVEFG